MLDEFVFIKPTQTYMVNDKRNYFPPAFCQVSKTSLFVSKQVVL